MSSAFFSFLSMPRVFFARLRLEPRGIRCRRKNALVREPLRKELDVVKTLKYSATRTWATWER